MENKAIGAMLGLAYGDALGWPHERPYKSKIVSTEKDPKILKTWVRTNYKNQVVSFKEPINKGEYSDDTQLAIAVARSLNKGDQWLSSFSRQELPFWSVYQRGGGSATFKALRCWLNGIEPWHYKRYEFDVRDYYQAGGNGVAMRIIPHVIFNWDQPFDKIKEDIFSNGIITHGHPRALLGAIVYGFAAWHLLNHKNQKDLNLIQYVLEQKEIWSKIPSIDMQAELTKVTWFCEADRILGSYKKIWDETTKEIVSYLEFAKATQKQTDPSSVRSNLTKLDCFNRTNSGSGVVSSMIAIYLTNVFVQTSDPIQGVLSAAYASSGSDTDTNASMTGGLIGSLLGQDWLKEVKKDIQDHDYLTRLGSDLSKKITAQDNLVKCIYQKDCNAFLEDVFNENKEASQLKEIKFLNEYDTMDPRLKVKTAEVLTRNNQKLFLSKTAKVKEPSLF